VETFRGGRRTKLGQKAEIFWMETRPTNREIGKTQKMVKALRGIAVRADGTSSERKAIPYAEVNHPVLDKLDSRWVNR